MTALAGLSLSMLLTGCFFPGSLMVPAGSRSQPQEAASPGGGDPAAADPSEDPSPGKTAKKGVTPSTGTSVRSAPPGSADSHFGGSAAPSQGDVKSTCRFKGKQLWGKVQVVDSFPDIKVQVVDSFPDVKVQKVTSFPDACGKWQTVDSFPDIKIQFVSSFPDVKIKYVDSFPGTN